MQKCLQLNLLKPTKSKEKKMKETYQTFLLMIHQTLPVASGASNRKTLHEKTYYELKREYEVASQLIIEATSYCWSNRKILEKRPERCIVRFDKRLFSFKETKRKKPVLSLRLNKNREGLPIAVDGAYKRLLKHFEDGWQASSVMMKKNNKFQVLLKKQFPVPSIRPNIIGIDVNSSNIALSIITQKEKVLKQTYWGKNVAQKQYQNEQRRSLLQRYRNNGKNPRKRAKAGLKLKRLSGKQKNYVKTSIWQLANDVVQIAKAYDANIAIEHLKHLRIKKGQWNKKSSRKTNRIPYNFFQHCLHHVAEREKIFVLEINPQYTSQDCPRCSHRNQGKWSGYSYFTCQNCSYEAHRDRTASLNIAKRAKEFFTQKIALQCSPLRNVVVNLRPC